MADNNGMPQKRKKSYYIFWIIVVILAVAIGSIGGQAVDLTLRDNGKVDIFAALSEFSASLDSPLKTLSLSAKSAINDRDSYSAKYAIGGGIIALIVWAYFATSKKRYHRKGEEHGSARWGTASEKKEIQDPNDLYNNVIVADDIFLVIDRKKREDNKKREKKPKAEKESKKQE